MPLLIKVVYMLHRILLTRPSAVNQKKRNRFSLSGLRFHLCLKTVHIKMDIELIYKSLNLKTNLLGMAVDHSSCCINIKLHVETYCVYIYFFLLKDAQTVAVSFETECLYFCEKLEDIQMLLQLSKFLSATNTM